MKIYFVSDCKASEMSELPARLIDWFHVLKVNEKVQEMKDQGIEQEAVMKEDSFSEEKLKSMCKCVYSRNNFEFYYFLSKPTSFNLFKLYCFKNRLINFELQFFFKITDSVLACSDQNDKEIEKAICLKPVQWMFHHLDNNNDGHLSETELGEIEDIQNEQCIKPFLQSCDLDKDGRVELTEFCRCLCVSKWDSYIILYKFHFYVN